MINARDVHTRKLDISRHVTECLVCDTANKLLLLLLLLLLFLLCEKLNRKIVFKIIDLLL